MDDIIKQTNERIDKNKSILEELKKEQAYLGKRIEKLEKHLGKEDITNGK